jgi:4-amino-4-deoxy-L-arabinose transferase-like glycosyltransferase
VIGRAFARIPWWVWSIAGLALLIRIATIGYGLPYELDPDERDFVNNAWRMVADGSFDPRWYGHPAGTFMGVLAVLYALYGAVGTAIGSFDSILDVGAAYYRDVTDFFVIGRAWTAITGVAVVAMTYAVVRELRATAFWAAVAALLVTLSLPMIRFSSIVRADMLLSVFMLAVIFVMLRTMERPSARGFVAAGILLGLAVVTKYPGVLAVVAIVYANVVLVAEKKTDRGLYWLAAAGLASVLVAAVVAPYLFINLRDTIAWIQGEARSTHLGQNGTGPVGNLWRYLTDALPGSLGYLGTIAGVAGLVVMLASRRERLVALTFWAYLAFISVLALWWDRWVLPLVPLAAIGAAFLLWRIEGRLGATRPRSWLIGGRIVAATLLVVPLVSAAVASVRDYGTTNDTRRLAIAWVDANVPEGSTLLIDPFTTNVETDRYEVLVANEGELVPWSDVSPKLRPEGVFPNIGAAWTKSPEELLDAIATREVDYIMLSTLWIEQFRAEAASYPHEVAVYETLLDFFPVVETFDLADAPIGTGVLVLDTTDVPGYAGIR